MKTKIITLYKFSEPVLCSVLRWDADPTTTDEPKVYVNYFYPFSVEDFEISDDIDNQILNDISNLIIKYCNKYHLRLWSY